MEQITLLWPFQHYLSHFWDKPKEVHDIRKPIPAEKYPQRNDTCRFSGKFTREAIFVTPVYFSVCLAPSEMEKKSALYSKYVLSVRLT